MDILVAVLIGSIVFLSALLIGMALMLRKQWDSDGSHPVNTRQGGPRRRR
jgi:hypothetical protein